MTQAERVRVSGPLAAHRSGFIAELERAGYSEQVAAEHLRLLNQLSLQLARDGVQGGVVALGAFARLAAARRAAGYQQRCTERALIPLAVYLGRVGVAVAPVPPPMSSLERLLDRYHRYLVAERGLADGTVERCLRTARRFLVAHAGVGGELELDLARLTSADISAYVLAQSRRSS